MKASTVLEARRRAANAPSKVQAHRRRGSSQLQYWNTRTAAESIVGCLAAYRRMPSPLWARTSFTHHEMCCFRVLTPAGKEIGTIRETFPTGSNDVWIARDGTVSTYIPVIADVVRKIDDRSARKVTIEPMEGLLDL